mmetsp:Transcript_41937/g.112330  ORF Transcript_41937/g.112330 Transcript_41937/m.112330 type:complete len:214 (+) Transcript_41937:2567-3208(+)
MRTMMSILPTTWGTWILPARESPAVTTHSLHTSKRGPMARPWARRSQLLRAAAGRPGPTRFSRARPRRWRPSRLEPRLNRSLQTRPRRFCRAKQRRWRRFRPSLGKRVAERKMFRLVPSQNLQPLRTPAWMRVWHLMTFLMTVWRLMTKAARKNKARRVETTIAGAVVMARQRVAPAGPILRRSTRTCRWERRPRTPSGETPPRCGTSSRDKA